MDLRKASMDIMTREFRWCIEEAIKQHPNVIDVKIVRGNVVTAHDYARRILIKARKEGFYKYTAEQIKKLKPPIRVHYCNGGIAFSGTRRRELDLSHWDNYKLPFQVLPADDARWVTLAVNPSKDEIYTLADLMVRSILECPIELRTKFSVKEVEDAVDLNGDQVHVFKNGRCIMLWPRREEQVKVTPVWERTREKTKGKKLAHERNEL